MSRYIVTDLLILSLLINDTLSNWDTKYRDISFITDINWNYCDLKCLYLEKYHNNTDFVVVTFSHVTLPLRWA